MENQSRLPQRTIKEPVEIEGIGLHTGFPCRMQLKPAPPGTGIVFQRSDLKHFAIPALRQYVAKVSYATSLMKQGVLIATVEHLLSAIAAMEIDNLYVQVSTMEVPIGDGSAQVFVDGIEKAGIREQEDPRQYIRLLQPVRIVSGDKWMEAVPCDSVDILYSIEFPHPLIQYQEFRFCVGSERYKQEIARARTFGFVEEVQALRQAGLARGGSLENAVVLSKEGILNPSLRYPDEFVRHKVLDLIGDLSLLGKPLIASIRAHRAGHALHYNLCSQILKNPACYKISFSPNGHEG
jgi:UDP-3-O-[3-hydroxymyristoyl] N-acetylglucosamine deacetylase